MPTDPKILEQRIACLESELAQVHAHFNHLGALVTSAAELIERQVQRLEAAATSTERVFVGRGLQIVNETGDVVIRLGVGPEGQPLIHLVNYGDRGEIKSVDENVLFPKPTEKEVNDD